MDERVAAEFSFNMNDPSGPWGWQADVVDWVREERSCIVLKARQIGVTWVGCGLGLWTALYQPGSLGLVYRQKHEDARRLLRRILYQWHSLPAELRNGAELIAPTKQAINPEKVVFRFPDGKTSTILAQSSADASGHGETVAFCLLDEFAYIENAAEIMKAVSSAVGDAGILFIISTAHGVSDEATGAGSAFHYLYTHAEEQGLSKRFLSWRLHPDRPADFIEKDPAVRRLRPWERAEQYPDNEHEAFALTSAVYFDPDALYHYGNFTSDAELRGLFQIVNPRKARFIDRTDGPLQVFGRPEEGVGYAIGADVATGQGLDFSAAYVIDLAEMRFVAEFHGKYEPDLFAEQLYFLGRWYNSAILAVEDAGGYGNAVIVNLRDGKNGRPAYPRLYHHRQFVREDQLRHKSIGFPMTTKTRPQVLSHMAEIVREKELPDIPSGLLDEMQVFCRHDPTGKSKAGPWPRAFPNGLHDDRVIAGAITLEMYRQHGHYEDKYRPKPRPRKKLYPFGTY